MRDRLSTAGLAGALVFAVAGVTAGALAGKPPAYDATASAVRTYVTAHHGALTLAGLLEVVAPLALVPFFAAMRRRLRDEDLGTLAFGFGILTVAMALLGGLVQNVLYHGGAGVADDSAVLVLFKLGTDLFQVGPAVASGGFLLAFAAGVFDDATVPRWVAPSAVVVAVIGLGAGLLGVTSSSGAPATAGLAGFLLTVAWTAATAIALLRPSRPAPATTASTATATA